MVIAIGIGVLWIVLGLAFALGWVFRARLPSERFVDVPRLVEIPTPVATCVACGEVLRPGPPTQLYLELWDVHGRQRAKWTVGKGERDVQSVQVTDAVGVARVNKEVWQQVARCNSVDQGGA